MADKHLPTLKLDYLDKKKHGRAVKALSLVPDQVVGQFGELPRDFSLEPLVELSLGALQSHGFAAMAESLETAASYFDISYLSFLLTQRFKVSFNFGDTTLVQDVRRFDIAEVLTKLQVTLGDYRLRLVAPSVPFSDACYNYRWRGTIFSFALGSRGQGIRAEYVAWHPSSSFKPASAIGLSIIRVQQRLNSDDRGQT